jgi:hypothetical protein
LIALWLFLEFLHIKEINNTHNFSPGMKITVDKMKILGITIPTNGKYEDLIKLTYDEKKIKIKDIIQSWSKRSLTLFGKVTIIKSLVKLFNKFTVLRIDFSLPSNKMCVSSAY